MTTHICSRATLDLHCPVLFLCQLSRFIFQVEKEKYGHLAKISWPLAWVVENG